MDHTKITKGQKIYEEAKLTNTWGKRRSSHSMVEGKSIELL